MAKATKAEAEYQSDPKGAMRCGVCKMFQAPATCTAVEGRVSSRAYCKYFERVAKPARRATIASGY